MTRHRLFLLLLGLTILLVLSTGCAAGVNEQLGTPDARGVVAGFWLGLWHGLIAPMTFIVSLFTDRVHVFEVHNNGSWYDFGFVLGASVVFGGSGKAQAHAVPARGRKERRRVVEREQTGRRAGEEGSP